MILREPGAVTGAPLERCTEVPQREPGPGQIRVRVSVCGVCRTDLHTVEGDLQLPHLPLIPGHQAVGVVDRSGAGATRYRPGDRVGVGWMNSCCGRCEYCLGGRENLCPQARFTGLDADGGYARSLVVDEDFAYAIPDRFADADAAPLLCAGVIGFRTLRLSEIRPGQRLGLYGFGASAHIAIQVARHWDCPVYVFTRGEGHRQLALQLGACWAGSAQEQPPQMLDAGAIFAPAGRIVPLALNHLRPGGTLAINAIHMSPIPEMAYATIYEERTLRSVANFTRQDAREFLELAAEIPVRTTVETFSLHEANTALERLAAGRIQGAAVLEVAR